MTKGIGYGIGREMDPPFCAFFGRNAPEIALKRRFYAPSTPKRQHAGKLPLWHARPALYKTSAKILVNPRAANFGTTSAWINKPTNASDLSEEHPADKVVVEQVEMVPSPHTTAQAKVSHFCWHMPERGLNVDLQEVRYTAESQSGSELFFNSECFSAYVESVWELIHCRQPVPLREWRARLSLCLDGEPNRVLRGSLSQTELRQKGAFFTGARMAATVARVAEVCRERAPVYFDPACGAGDLLLAVAARLPLRPTFPETLEVWGSQLAGCDISADFVRLAKARLLLLAAKRCRIRPPLNDLVSSDSFPKIAVADYFAPTQSIPTGDVIVMNPPFMYAPAPDDCDWASGRVNVAALFVDHAIQNASSGTRIVAILPDVLRSGSRYIAWRNKVRASGSVMRETPLGLFDQRTDVDVYLLHLEKGVVAEQTRAACRVEPTYGVGRRFSVHVGPVVPHRHPELGPRVSYVHARSLPRWRDCTTITESRQFAGRLFGSPFVCVRRTSRPGSNRAVASLVLGRKRVAVENHLLVLVPKDGSERTCRRLMRRLASPKTDKWLNARLRCRHLTTRALAEMPWWYKP